MAAAAWNRHCSYPGTLVHIDNHVTSELELLERKRDLLLREVCGKFREPLT